MFTPSSVTVAPSAMETLTFVPSVPVSLVPLDTVMSLFTVERSRVLTTPTSNPTLPLSLSFEANVKVGLAAKKAVRLVLSVTVKIVSTAAFLFLMFTLLPVIHFCI